MKKPNKKSFRIVFQSAIILFFVIVLIVQINILSLVNSFIETANNDHGVGIVKTSAYRISDRIEKIEKLSDIVSQSRDMQLYITSKDEYQKKVAFSNVFNDIRKVIEYTNENMCVLAWDKAGKTYEVINTIDSSDRKLIESFYSEKNSGKLKNGIRLFVDRGAVIICKFKDIDMYNLSSVGIDRVGTLGVVTKIYITELKSSLNISDDVLLEIQNISTGERFEIVSPIEELKKQTTNEVGIETTGWVVRCKTPEKRIPSVYVGIRNNTILVLLICFVFLLVFTLLFHKMFTSPTRKIFSYLDGYAIGGKKQRLESVGTQELDILLGHINDMFELIEQDAHQIVLTQEELYEKEIEVKNVLLYMYQLQIQPHFLYNTLGCINGYAIEHNADEIITITGALADIFRYSMEEKQIVTLGDEIQYAQKYLSIQQMRYPSLFELRIDADDEALFANVPKMILQPIVENAIKHGILPTKRKGTINIKAFCENNRIRLLISDNGQGMTEERLKEVQCMIDNCRKMAFSSGRIGVSNVCKRIVLQYGEDYGINVASKENDGTTVEIELPLQYDCNDI